MKNQETKTVDQFRKEMIRIASEAGVSPKDVSREKFIKESGWDRKAIEELGQFSSLKKMYFAEIEVPKIKHGSQMIQAFRNKLAARVGARDFITEEMTNVLKDVLEKNPLKFHAPVKKSKSNKKSKRTIVAHWSDSHFGCNINRSEVQINEYNWIIAARRLALFIDQVCSYKPQYRKDTDLVLCINGDIIAGMIHDQEWFADLLVDQYAGTIHLLGQAISYAAKHFSKVTVVCTTGNHGRAMHKSSRDRAATHKYDSYESMAFIGLKHALSKHHNVEVQVPKTPFAILQIQGHHMFVTHGDTVLSVGNPGKALNMKSINDQINTINASDLGGNNKFSAVLVGHVHVPTVQLMEAGCMLMINGCASGTDPYAQSIGIMASNPTQQLFEVTPEHAVGDIRFIALNSADKKPELERIVEPYKKESREF